MSQNEYISYLVARTEKALRNRMINLAGQYNLTLSQFGVLRRLFEEDGLTVNDLDHRLFKDRVTIISVIDRLMEKGLISEHRGDPNPEENRYRLTGTARKFIPELIEHVSELEAHYTKALTPEEEAVFRTALEKLHLAALDF